MRDPEEHGQQPLDPFELTGALARHGLDYVLIGGVAMQVHGHVRTTRDMDLIADWTPENMVRWPARWGSWTRSCAAWTRTCLGLT